jgi:hypothetical protein
MSRTYGPRSLALVALGVMAFAASRAAQAAPCSELPNPVYLQVGDTQEPLMKFLGQKLRNSAVSPMSLVYVTSGSCTNIEAIYTGVNLAESSTAKYIPSATEDPAWTPSMPARTCTITTPGGAGQALDVANSATFVSSCDPSDPPPGIALYSGPIQAYVFLVPEASSQTAITAEEAYFLFGFGAVAHAVPWLDELLLFIRPITKSTILTIAANIGVPADRWKGVALDKSSEVLNAVATSTTPEATIGIMGAEVYDANRATTNSLAFRAFHQFHAYYPDSTATATDKQNVRDGHYTIWAPTVWLTHVDGAGVPTSARAKYVIDLVLGATTLPAPDFEPLDVVIGRGLVPDCAMQVSRAYEGGDLSPYTPDEPCGCYYASKNGTTSCTTCTDDDPCAAGTCRRGFCEAR